MDYEFLRDITGVVKVRMSMGHEVVGHWFNEEVMVRANQLEFAGDEMEEGMNYYDEESLSLCGVEDFLQVVAAYRNFVQQK
ncbi:YacL family protein [Escherichia coli]|nr:YacL family protein [Escherichia coli]EIZ4844691.1 YacL family protein [Escherichia coli]